MDNQEVRQKVLESTLKWWRNMGFEINKVDIGQTWSRLRMDGGVDVFITGTGSSKFWPGEYDASRIVTTESDENDMEKDKNLEDFLGNVKVNE